MITIKQLLKWLLMPYYRFKRYRTYVSATKALKVSYEIQLEKRKELRKNINLFLRNFFGIDAKSKYIPKSFKNSEEVRVAIIEKFGDDMYNLSVKYEDLFK